MEVSPVQPAARAARSPAAPAETSAPAAPSASAAASKAPLLNPDPVIDASLGIVVLKYFSSNGDLTSTTPSPRQLAAYQIAANQSDGAKPG